MAASLEELESNFVLSSALVEALAIAKKKWAAEFNHPSVRSIHVGAALLDQHSSERTVLSEVNEFNFPYVRDQVQSKMKKLKFSSLSGLSLNNVSFSNEVEEILLKTTRSTSSVRIESDDLWLVLKESLGLSIPAQEESSENIITVGRKEKTKGTNFPYLEQYCKNLTEQAEIGKLDRAFNREEVVEQIKDSLILRGSNSIMLVGRPGVGKTAVVKELAIQTVVDLKGNPFLDNLIIFELLYDKLVAGASYKGELEERFRKLLDELASLENAILFIDEIHVMNMGGQQDQKLLQFLKPLLASGEVTVIGATTFEEYSLYVEPDEALVRRFDLIRVPEMSAEASLKVLKKLKPGLEDYYECELDNDILQYSIEISQKYISQLAMPDSVMKLLNRSLGRKRNFLESLKKLRLEIIEQNSIETLTHARLIKLKKYRDWVELNQLSDAVVNGEKERLLNAVDKELEYSKLSEFDLIDYLSASTGIPTSTIPTSVNRFNKDKFQGLKEKLLEEVKGQSHVVSLITDQLEMWRSNLKTKESPAGVFFFVGPTGTGKTQMAKALAKHLFGNEKRLIRFNMSEFSSDHSLSNMLGSPKGTVGSDKPGPLITKIRQQPFSIILFDEIEKAHPSLLNEAFLQLLDEGTMKDNHGREGDFKNSIVIYTSNLFADQIEKLKIEDVSTSKTQNQLKDLFTQNLNNKINLKKEFVGRLQIVPFKTLTEDSLAEIVVKELNQIAFKLEKRGINLTYSIDVVQYLLSNATNSAYGARDLQFAINQMVILPIAKKIRLEEASNLNLSMKGEELIIDL